MASRLQRLHTERTSRVGKPTRHGRRTVRIGRRPARTSVSLPPIRPLPENQRSSRLRATRATRVVFEVEENASDVSDESDIRPRQSRANCVSQVPVAARRVREFLREEYTLAFRHEHWHIGIVDAPIHSFLEPDSRPDVHWFPLPGRGKYLADPFGLPRGDGLEVLFEEVVLDLPFHASYPYLVERRGTVFCIPETSQGREVALYRAVEFPHRWTKEATLIRGVAAVDNTVFEHEGRFWLLHTDAEDGLFAKLRIWHAPELLGPWQPHEANPVKTDIRSSAPAG